MGSKKNSKAKGFDWGTTTSQLAECRGKGSVVLLKDVDRNTSFPSVLFYSSLAEPAFGFSAVNQERMNPAKVLRHVKRQFGDKDPEALTEPMTFIEEVPLTPLLAHRDTLRFVLPEAERQFGAPIECLLHTVPANFPDHAKRSIKENVEAEGVQCRLLPEPVAGAIAYKMEFQPDGLFLVYDLGGGTFDVTVLTSNGKELQVLATGGRDFMGGVDHDNVIIERILAEYEGLSGDKDEVMTDPAIAAAVRQQAESAKIALSAVPETQINCLIRSQLVTFGLPRSEFEELIRPMVEETLTITESVLQQAGVSASDLGAVLPIGGGSEVPLVREMLGEAMDAALATGIDSATAVASGAAIAAALADFSSEAKTFIDQSRTTDTEKARLRETLGDVRLVQGKRMGVLARHYGTPGSNGRDILAEILPANALVGERGERAFSPDTAAQTSVDVVVLIGSSEAEPSQCERIGQFSLPVKPFSDLRQSVVIGLEFSLDGLVVVTARDEGCGASERRELAIPRSIATKGA